MSAAPPSALDREVAFLSATAPFDAFEPEALRLVAFNAERRTLGKMQVVARRGEASNGGFVVVSGTVALDRENGSPHHRAGPGSTVGVLALVVPTRHVATITALESSTIIVLPRTTLARVLENFPLTARRWRAGLIRTLKEQAGDLEAVRAALAAVDGLA